MIRVCELNAKECFYMSIPWSQIVNSISNRTNNFLIAVSGGVDSVLLLDTICKSSIPKHNYSVIHFNHGIRQDSLEDAFFVKSLCEHYRVGFVYGGTSSLKGENNLEKKARIARWDFFETTAKTLGYDTVITAHHLNDYVENYIIGMIRGIHFQSCVMPRCHTNNGIHRFKPWLMEIDKETIYKIAKSRNLSWKEDYTNKTNDALRNSVRNSIIPEMMKSHNVLKTIPAQIASVLSSDTKR